MKQQNILLQALVFLLLTLNLQAQNNKIHKVDSILSAWYGSNTPSVSVLVMDEGMVRVKRSYGFANIQDEVKASARTNYDMATLSGQFTAMGVLILYEEGKVDLETPIQQIWSELPDYTKGVKVEHLVHHTSGLPVLQTRMLYGEIRTLEELFRWLGEKDQLLYQPGQKAGLNQTNNVLLADLIQIRSGESYRKFLDKRIFDPLGMDRSRVYTKGWFFSVPHKAVSYLRRPENIYEPPGEFPEDYLEGAIGVYSSLNDLEKWLMAWQGDTLIRTETLKMATRLNYIRGQKSFPGFGWSKAFNRGHKYLYQGGIGHGNSHIILRVPRENINVVILSNQGSLFDLRKRAFELVNLFSDRKYEPQ